MDLLKDLNFVMIHIICKMLVLIKNHLDYLKDNIFDFYFKKYNRILKLNCFIIYNDGKFKV